MNDAVDIFLKTSFGSVHALMSSSVSSQIPIVFIPGMLGRAEDWLNDFESFAPRRCVSISLRGRGQSDYPPSGFSVFDHVEDIEKLIEHLQIERFILVGFSQGALYATAFALKHPHKIAGLVIQDKVLKQKKFGKEWVERAKGHPASKGKEDFLWGIANDSQELNLLAKCDVLRKTPTLIIKGEHSAMVLDEDLMEMEGTFQNCTIEIFPDSSHDVSSPDYDLYVRTMNNFFKSHKELA